MERFADELERGFAGHSAVRMAATAVRPSPLAVSSRLRRLDSYLARFVRYPLAAWRRVADIYHIADHGYAHLAALLPRGRTVITCHDLMLLRADDGEAGFRGRRLSVARFRWSTSYLKRAARVVCDSHATKGDVIRLRGVPEGRVAVVPLGVDRRFRFLGEEAVSRLKAGIPALGRYAVLHVSTGDPYKNVPGTLQVLAALRQSGIDVVLVRVGKPLNQGERALAHRLRVAGAIIDCGRVSDERLVELYNAADVLLFPSYYEGFGWPPLEAMACGTPVVTSDCRALAEVVGDAGLMAPPEDTHALAAAVRSVLESGELAMRLRRLGLERAARYTWERTVSEYARVYAAVAEEAMSCPSEKKAAPQMGCRR